MVVFLSDTKVKKLSKFGQILVALFSFVVFGLIFWSWTYYPGDYDFFNSFISDLGRTQVEGIPNPTGSQIYTLAMIAMGLVSFGFWFFTWNVLYYAFKTKWKYLTLLGSISGMISSIIIGSTGFFPLDTQQETHNLLGMIYFGLGGAAITLYAIFFIVLFFANKTDKQTIIYSVVSVLITIIFAFMILGYYKDISTVYIVLLIGLLLIVNLVFLLAFKSFLNYLSYTISFAMLVLESIIILLVVTLQEVIPIMEVSFVLGQVAFMFINNVRIFDLDIS